MDQIFVKVLNMSIVASYMILPVMLFRIVLKKAPKYMRCILWGLVAVRLIIPVSLESRFSIIPNVQKVGNSKLAPTSYINTATENKVTENIDVMDIMSVIWVLGIVLMMIYMLISYIRIRVKIRESIKLRDNIWLCDHIDTPFVMGFFNPQIYLNSEIDKKTFKYVIAHEKAHIQRMDNVWKPVSFVVLSIHWFNPLCWIAYILFCKDIELSCDEKVIKNFDVDRKKEYSRALLSCSSKKYMITACPMVFGENNVKKRIIAILKYKKPAVSMVVTAVIVAVIVSVLFMTNPISKAVEENKIIDKTITQETPREKNKDKKAEKKQVETETRETEKATIPTTQPATEATHTVTQAETQRQYETAKPATQPPTKAEVYDNAESDNQNSLVEIQPFEDSEQYKKQFENYTSPYEGLSSGGLSDNFSSYNHNSEID